MPSGQRAREGGNKGENQTNMADMAMRRSLTFTDGVRILPGSIVLTVILTASDDVGPVRGKKRERRADGW